MKSTIIKTRVKTIISAFLLLLFHLIGIIEAKTTEKDVITVDDQATLIFTGKVESVTSYWMTEGKSRYIETTATIIPDKIEKNLNAVEGTPEKISVIYWGGTIGEVSEGTYMLPGGVVDLSVGETVRLYCIPALRDKEKLQVRSEYCLTPSEGITPSEGKGTRSFDPPDDVDENYGWGFEFDGLSWDSTNTTQTYRINENTSDMTGEDDEVEDGFDTWDDLSEVDFSFTRGADTTVDYVNLGDGINACFWDDLGLLGPVARLSYRHYSGRLVGWDMQFNDYHTWCNGAQSNKFDVQSVATHEVGHIFSLDDLSSGYYTSMTMWYTASKNSIAWRSLEWGDEAGAQYIYPNYNVPSVSISDPVDNEEWPAYTSESIVATASVSGGSISECKFKITTESGYTYDSGWTSMTYSGGQYSGSWSTGSRDGYYLVTVRAESNNGIYGYDQHTVYLPGPI